jgi:cyclopropane fatty-acyl-phospholipid synthase-like methyltransferase
MASGRSVFGIDQSAGMLEVAHAKHPDVAYCELALQDLATATDLHARFHGLMCVDAMEWVGREDWPLVLAGFHHVLRPGGWAYLAIEIPEDKDIELLAGPVPEEQVRGEIVGDGGFYAYFPLPEDIAGWLTEAGFSASSEHSGDGYRHLLLQSTVSPATR